MTKEFQYERGLLCLSADPPTHGHADLMMRAARKCRELIVGVLNNEAKANTYKFTLAQRVAMVERVAQLMRLGNVRVMGDDGLAVDLYLEEDCDVMFRGIRNENDASYEQDLADINKLLYDGVRNEVLLADPKFRLISSTLAKNLVSIHAGGERMLPLFVKQALEEVLLGQYLIGVTGCIASGKSWVSEQLVRMAQLHGCAAYRVNVDELIRKMYETDTPGAERVRQNMADEFGSDILQSVPGSQFTRVDRKLLASRLYCIAAPPDKPAVRLRIEQNVAEAQRITQPYVNMLFRKALRGLKGLVVVEWAQLAEMEMGPWMNLNAIVVDSPQREEMVRERNIPEANLAALGCVQWEPQVKTARLRAECERYGSGTIIEYSNVRYAEGGVSAALRAQEDVAALLRDKVLPLFPTLPKTAFAP